tara:strand:- start:5540 stop:5932 length:393 start_codon:yes stop_codon:yes gene_type:complete
MYLVHTENIGNYIHNVIIGICLNINEVTEIIWNYSRFIFHTTGESFKANNELIKISKISPDQYNILNNIYKKYEDEILDIMEVFKNWKDESCNVYFWYGIYDSEYEKDILFSYEDCKLITNIIKNTQLIK